MNKANICIGRGFAAVLGAAMLSAAAGSVCMAQESEAETEAAKQRNATICVVSITGNELTYYELETETEVTTDEQAGASADMENVTEEGLEGESEAVSQAVPADGTGSERPSFGGSGNMPDFSQGSGSGNMPDFSQGGGSGNMPDFSQGGGSGNMPDFSQGGGSGNMPDFSQGGGDGSSEVTTASSDTSSDAGQSSKGGWPSFGGSSDAGRPSFSGSGFMGGGRETVTTYLPVAVPVYTNTGEKMTYQILREGDTLDVVFMKDSAGNDVIVEMTLVSVSEDD